LQAGMRWIEATIVALRGHHLEMTAGRSARRATGHCTRDSHSGVALCRSGDARSRTRIEELALCSCGLPKRVRGCPNALVCPPGTADADPCCILSGVDERSSPCFLLRRCICCETDSPLTVLARTLSIRRRYRGTSFHTGQFFPHLFCDMNGVILEFYVKGKLCEHVD
jgi:hypothetical protein